MLSNFGPASVTFRNASIGRVLRIVFCLGMFLTSVAINLRAQPQLGWSTPFPGTIGAHQENIPRALLYSGPSAYPISDLTIFLGEQEESPFAAVTTPTLTWRNGASIGTYTVQLDGDNVYSLVWSYHYGESQRRDPFSSNTLLWCEIR
ncbi:MAG: hypothetical protein IPK99_12510 [Flavobacteriales bacterium]|nr:hypothetical protein [Flavobacteriales bacterium]